MLSDLVTIVNSLKVKVLEKTLNRALIINGHLFREDLNGWVYVGKIVNKSKNNSFNFYNKYLESKPTYLDIGTKEKNFYPHTTLPSEVSQRLRELYEFCNNKKVA